MAKDASLDRVLGEIAKLRERRLLADELRRLVEPLREGNLEAVEGESELLTDLEAHVEEAFKQLEAIKDGARDQGLEAMTAALDDVSWEIASRAASRPAREVRAPDCTAQAGRRGPEGLGHAAQGTR